MWNLSFLIRDQICLPCIERQNLNHWTTREVPGAAFLLLYLLGTVYHIGAGMVMDWKGRVGSLDWASEDNSISEVYVNNQN